MIITNNIIKNTEILLSHYRYINNLNDMLHKEFDDSICNILASIYPAFLNKKTPLSDSSPKNIIVSYKKIVNKTLQKIKNDMYKAKNNGDSETYYTLYKTYNIINLYYINKKSIAVASIEQKLKLSHSHFNRYRRKAVALFAEYMIPIALKLGYNMYSQTGCSISIITVNQHDESRVS